MPAPANAAVAAKDAGMAEQIKQKALVREAMEYYERSLAKRNHLRFVQTLYTAGPPKIYVQLGRGGRGIEPTQLIVEMPASPEQRALTITRLREFVAAEKVPVDPASITDQGDRYLVVPMPPAK
jgi:hypothetical protein